MERTATFFAFIALSATALIGIGYPAAAQVELCGYVHQQNSELPSSRRFWIVAEHGGRAFLDSRTCLVGSLDPVDDAVTLSDAMHHCATLGQGGPRGEMGWQLPTMAELTSLDGDSWDNQKSEFEPFKIPPLVRSEKAYWTSTKWLGTEDQFASVIFSALTTIVAPLPQTMKASVWCVQGARATGLR